MRRFHSFKKQLNRRLTILVIPHSDKKSIQLNIPVFGMLGGLLAWTTLTLWSGFIASRHVDYLRAQTNEQILNAKVWYFSQEIKRSREYIDKVREAEIGLRSLLNLKSKQAIIQNGPQNLAMGGPGLNDQAQLARLLSGDFHVPVNVISQNISDIQNESQNVLNGFQEISDYVQQEHELFYATPSGWPAPGRVTSGYGMRLSPMADTTDDHDFHRGMDIANDLGTPVMATARGVVKVSSWHGGYGRLVIIDHGHGYETYYAHNSKLLVQPGDLVEKGQTISMMGTSGHSTGYHLHYEVWKNGRPVNPLSYIKLNS